MTQTQLYGRRRESCPVPKVIWTASAQLLVEFDVCLRDDVFIFFPRREVERERLPLDGFLLARLQFFVGLDDFRFLEVIANVVIAVAGVDESHSR